MFLYMPVFMKLATPTCMYYSTIDTWADIIELCDFYAWVEEEKYSALNKMK